MPLSDEQMKKVNQYFRLNGVVPDCPYCSMHGWDEWGYYLRYSRRRAGQRTARAGAYSPVLLP